MKINLYQVDAFASAIFEGNPAAICPLSRWISDDLMQKIASENNLSETAFFVEEDGSFRLRWFTPEAEVDLCGHATLAAAHVLFKHLGYKSNSIDFETRSGVLTVSRDKKYLKMNFPANPAREATLPEGIENVLGIRPLECYKGMDYLLVLGNEQQVADLKPNFRELKQLSTRGIICTARGSEVDFVSRFFAPAVGVDEDPVTGSAHTMLTPYWAGRLGKKELIARQISKRGGTVFCSMKGDRVILGGQAQSYLSGIIDLPD